jgi:hypothetical protein
LEQFYPLDASYLFTNDLEEREEPGKLDTNDCGDTSADVRIQASITRPILLLAVTVSTNTSTNTFQPYDSVLPF